MQIGSIRGAALDTRRAFLKQLSAYSASAAVIGMGAAMSQARVARGADPNRPYTVSILATEIRKFSHAQHFVDRYLEGYGWEGKHHVPKYRLASLYVDQRPQGDLTDDRQRRHGVPVFSTIAEALTLGGKDLAVDGVLIIAEHGSYPKNEKGQTLYPRYKFFKEIVKVFEASGKSVPVFNDKHLSTSWNECVEMVEDSRRLKFAFLAGSSLPVTWRIPSTELSVGSPLRESVCVCYGGVDSYDFHGLETAQCMSERRRGGESGVRSLHALRGDNAWKALAERKETWDLVVAAMARSHQTNAPQGYTFLPPTLERIRALSPDAVVYFMDHNDGFQSTMVLANGLVSDFNYAGRLDSGKIVSCQMHLPMPPRMTTTADFFHPLCNNIEQTNLAGKATYPVERTLLTSGMVIFGVESLYQGQRRLDTPELNVAYQPVAESAYWRS